MTTSWFDSHCHLQEAYVAVGEPVTGEADGLSTGGDAPATGGDPALSALRRARAAGVDRVICVGTDAVTSAQAVQLAHAVRSGRPADPDPMSPGDPMSKGDPMPMVWATIGLHPHEASSGTAAVARLLADAVASPDPAVVGVGECGLDYHYDHSPRDAQRRAFAEQITLAHTHGLTLVIHARDAWDDLFEVLNGEGVPQRAVLHCFTGGPEEARRCLDAGMYVSFSGIVSFKNAEDVRRAAALCPLDRLLVETDSPFLAPVPHRGRPNEPAFVPLVGKAVAEVRGMDPAALARSSAASAVAAFGL